MADPKTISNLPPDVSIRWATDQELHKEIRPLLQDAGSVSPHAQVDSLSSLPTSALDVLCGTLGNSPTWANFSPPKTFFERSTRLFQRDTLAPFLGSPDQQEKLLQTVEQAQGSGEGWQEEKALLLNMLSTLQQLSQTLIEITSKCKQYQKG